VTMREGLVGAQVAVPSRMMGAFGGPVSRAGAAGNAGDEELLPGDARGQQRDGGQQDGGGKAAGMSDMPGRDMLEEFWYRAGELVEAVWCAMLMSVCGGIAGCAAKAVVRRDVDERGSGSGHFGPREQAIDQCGRNAMRG